MKSFRSNGDDKSHKQLDDGSNDFQKCLFQSPRIGGIKVYNENIGRNEIIMDMDLM